MHGRGPANNPLQSMAEIAAGERSTIEEAIPAGAAAVEPLCRRAVGHLVEGVAEMP